jgi:hypothetical protein
MTLKTSDASEILPLTRNAVAKLIASRSQPRHSSPKEGHCRRQRVRWPFPGAAELWIRDDAGIEHHWLATCLDLSLGGIGIRIDRSLSPGTEMDIAVHQPEVSFHGRAVVRHCTPAADGEFTVGLEFCFPGTRFRQARAWSATSETDGRRRGR